MRESSKISLKLCLSLLLSVGAMVGMLGLFCTTPALGQDTRCVLAEINASASSKLVRSGNWTYELDEATQTATLVSYNVIENLNPEWIHHDIDPSMRESYGYGINLVIPATIDDIPVVAVGAKNREQSVFSECGNVTEITFEENSNISSINRFAFGEMIWLRKISIPKSVTFIDELAFTKSLSLDTINLIDNDNFTLEDGVLFSKDKTTLICYPAGKEGSSYSVPDGVERIGGGAFGGALHLESVNLPSSVTSVGDLAFTYTGVTQFAFTNNVASIGQGCFANCEKLKEVILPVNEQFVTIEKGTFAKCKRLSSIFIPNSVATIGADAFFMCRALQSIVIPESVSRIESRAFSECVSLSSIVFEHTSIAENFIRPTAFLTKAIKPVVKLSSDTVLTQMKEKYSDCFTNAPTCFEIKSTKVVIGNLTLYTKFGDTENYYLDNLCTVKFGGKVNVPTLSGGVFNGYWAKPCAGGERVVDSEGNLLVAISTAQGEIELYPYFSTGKNEDWNYTLEGNTAHIISYLGSRRGNFSIPAYIIQDGVEYKVTSLGKGCTKENNVFYSEPNEQNPTRDNLVVLSLEIPGSIECVEPYSFYKCEHLGQVVIGEGVTEIGEQAFYCNKSLRTVEVAGSVKTIGTLSFRGCTALESVILHEGVSQIKNYAFFGCAKLQSLVLPKTITKISANAFGACKNLRFVTEDNELNDAVASEQFNTNLNLKVKEYLIKKDVTEIDPTKFNSLELAEFTVEEGNTAFTSIDGILYSLDKKVLVRCPVGYTGVVSVVDGVEIISDNAFNSCAKITGVKFANSVKHIGKWAFAWCSGISELKVPSSVKVVDEYAFKNCSALKKITFQAAGANGVVKINKYAFEYCENLQFVSLPTTLNSIGSYAFANCSKLREIDLPDSITDIKSGAFRSSGLVSVSLPENQNYTEVSFNTFGFCKSLTKVYIPANVTKVGEYAFAWTTKLYKVNAGSTDTKYSATSFMTSIKNKHVNIVVGA